MALSQSYKFSFPFQTISTHAIGAGKHGIGMALKGVDIDTQICIDCIACVCWGPARPIFPHDPLELTTAESNLPSPIRPPSKRCLILQAH